MAGASLRDVSVDGSSYTVVCPYPTSLSTLRSAFRGSREKCFLGRTRKQVFLLKKQLK